MNHPISAISLTSLTHPSPPRSPINTGLVTDVWDVRDVFLVLRNFIHARVLLSPKLFFVIVFLFSYKDFVSLQQFLRA